MSSGVLEHTAALAAKLAAWERWAIYQPFGTYFKCRVCGCTWWSEGLFRTPQHRSDCLMLEHSR